MNILIISTYKILPVKNAGHKGIVSFANDLSKHVNVFLVGTKNNEDASKYNFKLMKLFADSRFMCYGNIFYFFSLLKIVRQKKINIISFEQPYLPIILLLFKIFTRIPCIYYSRNIEYLRFKSYHKKIWRVLFYLEYLYYKLCNHIFSVSEQDINYAINTFKILPSKIHYMPAGVPFHTIPNNKKECRQILLNTHHIDEGTLLILFVADLGYMPNTNALDKIVNYIIPSLNLKKIEYKIIICGQNLPLRFNEFKNLSEIIFAGFVSDIAVYNIGVDVFINPVIEGGGVKVKLLEALAYNLYCVSTKSGAEGIRKNVCGEKLHITNDTEWNEFANKIIAFKQLENQKDLNIPNAFYQLYSMDAIIKKATNILNYFKQEKKK